MKLDLIYLQEHITVDFWVKMMMISTITENIIQKKNWNISLAQQQMMI